jgi:hypothetical protein
MGAPKKMIWYVVRDRRAVKNHDAPVTNLMPGTTRRYPPPRLEQSLHDDDVPPRPIELPMALISAHFPEAELSKEGAARGVLREHPRQQLRQPRVPRRRDEVGHRDPPRAPSARSPLDVHREVGVTRVAAPSARRRRRSEGDDPSFLLDDDDRVRSLEPREDVRLGSTGRLERGDSILDPLAVYPRDLDRIRSGRAPRRKTRLHGEIVADGFAFFQNFGT